MKFFIFYFFKKSFERSLTNVKRILEYLKRVVSYENRRPSDLIDKAKYPFGLMEFWMFIF